MSESNDIAALKKDIQYIRENMTTFTVLNTKEHTEIKDMIIAGLKEKVGVSRFKPVELMAYSLASLVAGSVIIALVAQVVHAFL